MAARSSSTATGSARTRERPGPARRRSTGEAPAAARRRDRVRVLGRGADARDPRRATARAVRRHQPGDLHVDHRHRARRHRPRRVGRWPGRRPHRPPSAPRAGDRARRRPRDLHRAHRPAPRRVDRRGRQRVDPHPQLRRVLPARGRAELGHAHGGEAATPSPLEHRWDRRPPERHLDRGCAGRHLRDRVRARGDDAHADDHRRHRHHPRGARSRAHGRAVATPPPCDGADRGVGSRWVHAGASPAPSRARSRARTTACGWSTIRSVPAAASSGSTTSVTATWTSRIPSTSSSTTRARSPTR